MLALVPAPNAEPREVPLPLEHTAVRAHVHGYIGTVDVTQQFQNPYDEKIEAVYLFPLPEKAAVSEFVMTIGERKIRGILREKEEALRIYRDARAQGYRASLLTQHRPNIFEQKVANIEPGKRIDVNIRYFHTLAYEDGWYSFVFPTVIGPRYNPAGSKDPVAALPREDVSTPASGAAVRYLRPNERSAHDISIAVDVDAGVAIEELNSSHPIHTVRNGESVARVELAGESTLPNRDFVLSFRVAGATIKANLLTYADPETGDGYFTLMIYPPSALAALGRRPVEMVFVVDTSGSMAGRPLEQAAEAIAAALDRLDPSDTFQILNFSDSVGRFAPAPMLATQANVAIARNYVRNITSAGGTEMLSGIRAALDFAPDPERARFVTFLTDGYIGNETEILGYVQRSIAEARIFSFGVGNSVNRYLLDGLAREGRGAAAYLGLQDSADVVMAFYFDRISRPALTDLAIDWNGMRATDVYPQRLPDLFVGRPVVVTGRYAGDAHDLVVRGRVGTEPLALPIAAEPPSAERASLRSLWARLRIEDLASRQLASANGRPDLVRAIRDTALEYGLMSQYTAFIAVDGSERTAGRYGTTVFQAVPVPDGVRYDTTVAEE
jgi:Ca-activated chloride channel family protein